MIRVSKTPTNRIKLQSLGGEPKTEYDLQKRISRYMETHYPTIQYRVDIAGSNLSMTQATKNKVVNKRRGWHDFEVYDLSGGWVGLCIELKKAGTRLTMQRDSKIKKIIGKKKIARYGTVMIRENKIRKAGDWVDNHIEEQADSLQVMRNLERLAAFGVGLDNCLKLIEGYLNNNPLLVSEGLHEKERELIFPIKK
jgi:hypothetical protein